MILNSIQSRRDALFKYYNLPCDAENKANYLFDRMEQFGYECKDQADFETRLISSPLNEEYKNLFIEFAPFVKKPDNVPTMQEHLKNAVKGAAVSAVEHQAKSGIKSWIVNKLFR